MTTSPKPTKDEAMKLALDALESIDGAVIGILGLMVNTEPGKDSAGDKVRTAINAVREALAQPAADDKAGGEPVDTGDITGYRGLLPETGWDEWPEPKPKSATHGMNLGQRIAHVGGRITEKDTVEFGSVMAVKALIHHVLRDTHPQPQADKPAEPSGITAKDQS